MDNQINTQEPVDQTIVNQEPVVEQPPVPPNNEPANPEPVEAVEPTPVSEPETTIPQSEPTITEVTPEPPVLSEPTVPPSEYHQVLDQYATAQQPVAQVEPPVVENSIRSSEEQLQNLGITVPPKTNSGIFKIIFIVALVIFLLVSSALVFVYFKSQKNQKVDNSNSTNSTVNSASQNTPTSAPKGTCMLNDKTYNIGESFIAADGCNSCTCSAKDMITCTEKTCLAPSTSTSSAKTATPTPIK